MMFYRFLQLNFYKRFKRDSNVVSSQAILLSQDITPFDIERLTNAVIGEEITQVVQQINPRKAPGPDGIYAIFCRQRRILLTRIFVQDKALFKARYLLRELTRTNITSISENLTWRS